MKRAVRFALLILLALCTSSAYALDQTETGFFYPIGTDNFETGTGWWLSKDPDYFSKEYHLGVDMMAKYDSDVYAIADGRVKPVSDDGWGDNNCALVVEHDTYEGETFTAIYGHLQCSSLAKKSRVSVGEPVGKIGHWKDGAHLHFGIHPGPYSSIAKTQWGRRPIAGNWTDPCTDACLNGFTDPILFIQTHYAYNPSVERQVVCQANICWELRAPTCESATSHYRIVNPPYAQFETAGVCRELQANLETITGAPNPQERIPEDHGWRTWWRAFLNVFGEIARAEEMKSFYTHNVINVYTGTVVAGNAALAIHGAGPGYATEVTEPPAHNLPDFVAKKIWLETPWGVETYQYGRPEIVKMKTQFANVGTGSCSGDIEVHFYLSRGFKEDTHSGDGSWKRVGTDNSKCENLQPGQTHTETEGIELWRDIPDPGIWNVVACIDHVRDDHNNGGAHPEKHESNNCSTEAVFEVTADGQVVNVPDIDFTAHSLRFLQTPTYAGDQARLGGFVTNVGSIASFTGIRSSYSVECSGTGRVYLTDDGTDAVDLTPNKDNWEETLAAVTMPNVAGACTAYFCADYQGAIQETNEANNCSTLSFTLQPHRAPRLAIIRFQDETGCCTSNLGSRIRPDIWVRNNGPVAPATDVRVLYQISSPVATGGRFETIGWGSIRPSELPPGGVDEDYMDGSWSIPKNNAWKKQWHTVRACLREDGGTPTGNPGQGEICGTYGRYSKK